MRKVGLVLLLIGMICGIAGIVVGYRTSSNTYAITHIVAGYYVGMAGFVMAIIGAIIFFRHRS
jgi:hypothetical protein